METNLVITDEIITRAREAGEAIKQKLAEISHEVTPKRDDTGRTIIGDKAGQKYIIEAYMREQLDKGFPGWSWEGLPVTMMGSEWILAQGHLIIIDINLLALGIIPPIRKFHGVGGARIQYKKCPCVNRDNIPGKPRGMAYKDCGICHGQPLPHTPENVIDIDKNIKSANSGAFKYAINRLTHIGDDVYGKRLDFEGQEEDAIEEVDSKELVEELKF
jgi:hypothetical protein